MTDSTAGSEGFPIYGEIYENKYGDNLSPHEDKVQRLKALQTEMKEALAERWFADDDFTAMFLRTSLFALNAAIEMEEQDLVSDHFVKGNQLRARIVERANKDI